VPVAFQPDREGSGLAAGAAVLVFSEFGRRVAANATHGTDHGTAVPVFIIGGAIRRGLVGTTPSLIDLEDGDLKTHIDFRRVHAAALDDWLGLPSGENPGGPSSRCGSSRAERQDGRDVHGPAGHLSFLLRASVRAHRSRRERQAPPRGRLQAHRIAFGRELTRRLLRSIRPKRARRPSDASVDPIEGG
jgi:hypothetical protein